MYPLTQQDILGLSHWLTRWASYFALGCLVIFFAVKNIAIAWKRWNLRRSKNTTPEKKLPDIMPLIAQKTTAIKIAGRALVWVLLIGAGAAGDHFYLYHREYAAWQATNRQYHQALAAWTELAKSQNLEIK